METLKGKSKDIVAENISKIKELFPEVFCENKIDLERLQEVLGEYIEDKEERYSFNWKGKSKAIRIAQTQSTGTLRPVKEESKNWDTTENLYIEGDNLEVLKLLQKTYHGEIKMIYIDPPYNTGNDFVYPDNYSDNIKNYLEITGQVDSEGKKICTNSETSGRYHTDWLNMMYPRLKLAKNLLSDDGVIFLSIDDTEVSNLRKICDEVFGENNFIKILKWKKKKQPSFLHGHVAGIMEYILVYARATENLEKLSVDITSDSTKRIDNSSNKQSKRLIRKGIQVKLSSDISIIKKGVYKNKTMETEFLNDVFIINGRTINDFEAIARFRNDQSSIDRFVAEDVLFITKNYSFRRDLVEEEKDTRKSITDLLLDWGDNQDSDKEITELFNIKVFDYTKPTKLIYNLNKSIFSEDSIVLDFFSGSSTTAHAVMQLNSEDNGKRKFIMVQLPEITDEKSEAYKAGYKNICEIGKERIRRAGEKILKENKDEEEVKDIDIGFKVFKLDSSNIKKWTADVNNLELTMDNMIENFLPDRTEDDIVYEIMLKYGIDLTSSVEMKKIFDKKVFIIGAGELFICIDDEITLEIVEELVKLKDELKPKITRIVFKDNGFKDDSIKTNAIQIFKRNKINEIMSV